MVALIIIGIVIAFFAVIFGAGAKAGDFQDRTNHGTY